MRGFGEETEKRTVLKKRRRHDDPKRRSIARRSRLCVPEPLRHGGGHGVRDQNGSGRGPPCAGAWRWPSAASMAGSCRAARDRRRWRGGRVPQPRMTCLCVFEADHADRPFALAQDGIEALPVLLALGLVRRICSRLARCRLNVLEHQRQQEDGDHPEVGDGEGVRWGGRLLGRVISSAYDMACSIRAFSLPRTKCGSGLGCFPASALSAW